MILIQSQYLKELMLREECESSLRALNRSWYFTTVGRWMDSQWYHKMKGQLQSPVDDVI
jgi:hypothetical protein